jgi:hypothetical protein
MSRNTDVAITSASWLPQVRYRALVEVWSLSGPTTLRFCNGGNFVYTGANTYTPVGGIFAVGQVQEDTDPFARSLKGQFACVYSSQISDMLAENLFRKPVKLYRAFLASDYSVVGTPQLMHVGYIDKVSLKYGDPSAPYFEFESESRLRQSGRPRYFNRETLQQYLGFTGDTFFDYVTQIPLFKSTWSGLPHGLAHTTPGAPPTGVWGWTPGFRP